MQFCIFCAYPQYINDSIQTNKLPVKNNTSNVKKKSLFNYFGIGANAGINFSTYNETLLSKEFKYGYTYYTYSANLLTPIVNLSLTQSLNSTVHTFSNDYKLTKWEFNLAPLLKFESRSLTMLAVYINEFNWSKYETNYISDTRMNLSAIISWDNDYYKTNFPGLQQVNITSNRFYVGTGYIIKAISNLGSGLQQSDRGKKGGASQQYNSMLNSMYYDSYGNFSFWKYIIPTPLADIGYQINHIENGINNQVTNENGLFVRLGLGYVRNIMIGKHILVMPSINWILYDKLVGVDYDGVLQETSFNAALKVQIYL